MRMPVKTIPSTINRVSERRSATPATRAMAKGMRRTVCRITPGSYLSKAWLLLCQTYSSQRCLNQVRIITKNTNKMLSSKAGTNKMRQWAQKSTAFSRTQTERPPDISEPKTINKLPILASPSPSATRPTAALFNQFEIPPTVRESQIHNSLRSQRFLHRWGLVCCCFFSLSLSLSLSEPSAAATHMPKIGGFRMGGSAMLRLIYFILYTFIWEHHIDLCILKYKLIYYVCACISFSGIIAVVCDASLLPPPPQKWP